MLLHGENTGNMARADLHVHSTYSEHPSEWFLQRLGAKESYTDPETIYRMARERGMDFVTITDHNRIEGALLLKEKYPEDTFTGVEFTTYFPEDDCKIHILVYGIDRKQFEEMQDVRTNIYNFWRYIMENNIVYSVAHATYSVNGLLKIKHLEKLMLMFDVFEGINGGRNNINNTTWRNALSALGEESMRELSRRHDMEPSGLMPWRKSLTGGSDDHAGLFVGQTCTRARASSPEEFLQAIAGQRTVPEGRSNNYQSLVFTVYKIAYEFSRSKPNSASRTFFSSLTEFIFEKKNFKLKERLFLKRLSASSGSRANLYGIINSLIKDVRKNRDRPMEERLDIVYDRIADLSDEFMRSLVNSIKEDVIDGDLVGFVTNASASIPGIFLSIPFFTAVRDMFSNKALLDELKYRYMPEKNGKKSIKVMWFTDTFTDLNGVSVT
ncbi:MAG: phosphoesterase, partial [Candidatus Aegiribacteria sp.]|nr:phosphoesterase [Candidatus Aegiribacteria sp.]